MKFNQWPVTVPVKGSYLFHNLWSLWVVKSVAHLCVHTIMYYRNRNSIHSIMSPQCRHAAMAERRVNMNQGRTENTLSANRQSDIEREYREEFRDGQRLDAVDKIDTSLKKGQKTKTRELSMDEQLKAYRLACVIFEVNRFIMLVKAWQLLNFCWG